MKGIVDDNWLRQALTHTPQPASRHLAGCDINLLCWGRPDNPGVLLVHGGGAHAAWWRFIAPFLQTEFYCVAMDLSGHGDSGHRAAYDAVDWRDEVLQVAADRTLFSANPVVIGHSMGALVGIAAAAAAGSELDGLIIIDAAARPATAAKSQRRSAINLLGRHHSYATREDALQRFRLIPPQPCENTSLLAYIAEQSVTRRQGRWEWKYDHRAFRDRQPSAVFEKLRHIRCRVAIIRGQHSRVLDSGTATLMAGEIASPVMQLEIPLAHHHIMLDQPVALISAIRGILGYWQKPPCIHDHETAGQPG